MRKELQAETPTEGVLQYHGFIQNVCRRCGTYQVSPRVGQDLGRRKGGREKVPGDSNLIWGIPKQT